MTDDVNLLLVVFLVLVVSLAVWLLTKSFWWMMGWK